MHGLENVLANELKNLGAQSIKVQKRAVSFKGDNGFMYKANLNLRTWVAEGSADVYPRYAPTMEWDTAAGHAIAHYAGKKLVDLETKKDMTYNRPILKNNWFIVK